MGERWERGTVTWSEQHAQVVAGKNRQVSAQWQTDSMKKKYYS